MSKAKKNHRQVFEESLVEARRRARYSSPQGPMDTCDTFRPEDERAAPTDRFKQLYDLDPDKPYQIVMPGAHHATDVMPGDYSEGHVEHRAGHSAYPLAVTPLHGARPLLERRLRQAGDNPDRFPTAPEPKA